MKYLIEYDAYDEKQDDYVPQIPLLVDGDNKWDAEQRFRCGNNGKLGVSIIVNRVWTLDKSE